MIHFFRLIRPINITIIILTMYGLGWYFDMHVIEATGHSYLFSLDYFLLVISTAMIASAGNIINDYFDVRADRINRPDRVIIGKHIKKRVSIVTHWGINATAFAIAIYLSIRQNSFWYVFIHMLSINFLWFYSMYWKRRLVVGNIIVAGLTALVPILVGFFFAHIEAENLISGKSWLGPFNFQLNFYSILFVATGLAIFAFLLNWAREIVKDIEDVDGDKVISAKTMAIHFGIKKSKNFALFILLLPILFSILSYFILNLELSDWKYFVPVIFSAISLIISILLLITAKSKSQFRKCHQSIKVAMIFGMLLPIFWVIMEFYV